ncbi:MAG: flagellar assembly protein A, partial [bacterium]
MIKDFRLFVIREKFWCTLLDYGPDSNGLSSDRIKAAIESLEVSEFNFEAITEAIKEGKFTTLEISDAAPETLDGTCWVINTGEADIVKVGIAPPHGEGEHVTFEKIVEEIAKAGFGKYKVLDDIINRNLQTQKGSLRQDILTFNAAEKKDGKFEIEVSRDKMSALLTFIAPKGGEPVTKGEILSKLGELGVKFGINEELIDQILKENIDCAINPVAVGT